MTMNELIAEILILHGIPVHGSVGKQTAFEKLEAAIMGALDEMYEEEWCNYDP